MCSISNIIWNIPNLVKIIELDQNFLSSLVRSGLLTENCLATLQNKFGNDPAKLCFKVLRMVDDSGSDATERLADVLMSLNNEQAVRLLAPCKLREAGSDGCFPSSCKNRKKPRGGGEVQHLSVKVIPSTKLIQGEAIYKLRGGCRRGLALVVNNENFSDPHIYSTRRGSKRDVENITSLLSQMGFHVITRQDLSRKEMLQTFLDFSSNEKHGDIMVVVVMSHGVSDMKLVSSDGKLLDYYKDILRYFNNNCDILRNKPKVFLFQACQGEEVDLGVLKTKSDAVPLGSGLFSSEVNTASPPGSPAKEAVWKDMILACSTVAGYVSWRSPEQGSWYIQTLCEVFMNHSHEKSLRRMLDMISQKIEDKESSSGGKQQTTYSVIGFNKDLFFNPGISID